MSFDVPLKCSCGAVSGIVRGVTHRNARRLSCMCDDCQAYAHYLGRAGEILDPDGGTDLSYAVPARISMEPGRGNLRCVRLTRAGVLRWYAGCCNTPIAHTVANPATAFVGIPHLFMDHRGTGRTRDELLGPLTDRFQARFAKGQVPEGAHTGTPLRALITGYATIYWDSLLRRNRPSPFFDVQTGKPVVAPKLLSAAELDALRSSSSSRPG